MSAMREKRIELWVEARNGIAAVNPIMQSLLNGLAADGASVRVVVPEHEVAGAEEAASEPRPDLVLLKTATTLGLSRAIAAEAGGQAFLNAARASWRASDKAAVVALLAAAGLPVPVTYLTVPGAETALLPAERVGEWISKPVRGIHGRNVVVHAAFPEALRAQTAGPSFVVDDGSRLVQRRVGRDDEDLKVYVAGGRCFAGRKRFGPNSFRVDAVDAVTLPLPWAEVVLAAGDILGLRCFGVDLRTHDGNVMIIDVNPFPGYRGFPESKAALRSSIEAALGGRSA